MALDSVSGIMNFGTSGTGGTSEKAGRIGTSGKGREFWILNWVRAVSSHQRGGKKGYEKAQKNDPDNKSCKNKLKW